MTFDASPPDAGKRLDAFLHERLPECSRSRLQSWIKGDRVLVNGAPSKAAYVLRGSENVVVDPLPLPALKAEAEDLPLRIVYEDDDVVVVDKPSGMVVHAGAGHHSGTLVNALLHHFGSLSSVSGDLRPGIVHRIDRETSGLLVVARTDAAQYALSRQFHDRTVEKTYVALVHGRVKAQGRITAPITRDPIRRTRMTCKLGTGRSAVTEYRPVEDLGHFTLLEVRIGTGRTHQIRVHLASLRHPIVGDGLYGAPAQAPGLPPLERFYLHAHRLSFNSPSTGERLQYESPLPQDFLELLAILRSRAARMEASG